MKRKKNGQKASGIKPPKPIPKGLPAVHCSAAGLWAAGVCLVRFVSESA